jgi:methyl-accepting chemotaxis protein
LRIALARLAGLLLILTALTGIILMAGGLYWTLVMLPDTYEDLHNNVRVLNEALATTSEGLVLAEQSLEMSISSTVTLEDTIIATGRSIRDTTPMLETMVLLSRDDLPNAVSSAQLSIDAAQDSAEIIDNVLSFITGLPFVPRDLYNPPVPLHVALGQVSESLENIPESLETIEASLTTTGLNLIEIEDDIYLIAADVNEINTSMVEARGIIYNYQVLIGDLQTRTDDLEAGLPESFDILTLFLTVVFVWAGLSQIGLLFLGFSILAPPR